MILHITPADFAASLAFTGAVFVFIGLAIGAWLSQPSKKKRRKHWIRRQKIKAIWRELKRDY